MRNANEANFLHNDRTLRAVAGRWGQWLAWQPTLTHLENSVDWDSIRLLSRVKEPSTSAVTARRRATAFRRWNQPEDRTHAQHVFPLLNQRFVDVLFTADLRREERGAAGLAGTSGQRHGEVPANPRLGAVVGRMRARFVKRAIVLRADTAFCPPELLDYNEYTGIRQAIGFGCDDRVLEHVQGLCEPAKLLGNTTLAAKGFASTLGARSWVPASVTTGPRTDSALPTLEV